MLQSPDDDLEERENNLSKACRRLEKKLGFLEDSLNDDVRVYVGDKEETWHKDNIDIDVEDWIPAVIASENDEPLRKIKVNPKSYVDTTDDTDLVDCTVAGKVTQLPKHAIRILV